MRERESETHEDRERGERYKFKRWWRDTEIERESGRESRIALRFCKYINAIFELLISHLS